MKEEANVKIYFNNLTIGSADVKFILSDGDRLAVIGKNGVGKTTLLKKIWGLQKSDFKLNSDIKSAAVFQDNILDEELSIFNNLKLRSFSNNELASATNILKKLNLIEFNKKYGTLSGGEKRMVDFTRAAMLNPELLILDELSSGLDISSLSQVWKIINNNLSKNIKIIFTTHHLEELKYANKLLFIKDNGFSFFENIDDFLTKLPKYKLILHSLNKFNEKQLFFNHFNEAIKFAQNNNINLDNIEILNPTYNDLFNSYYK